LSRLSFTPSRLMATRGGREPRRLAARHTRRKRAASPIIGSWPGTRLEGRGTCRRQAVKPKVHLSEGPVATGCPSPPGRCRFSSVVRVRSARGSRGLLLPLALGSQGCVEFGCARAWRSGGSLCRRRRFTPNAAVTSSRLPVAQVLAACRGGAVCSAGWNQFRRAAQGCIHPWPATPGKTSICLAVWTTRVESR